MMNENELNAVVTGMLNSPEGRARVVQELSNGPVTKARPLTEETAHLDALVDEGMAVQSTASDGAAVYYITDAGRLELERLTQ